jgi:hypothetical protein
VFDLGSKPAATVSSSPEEFFHARFPKNPELYNFSIIQRKVLTPNDFASLEEVEERLRLYEELSNREPRPFEWKFDRAALRTFLAKLEARRELTSLASVG